MSIDSEPETIIIALARTIRTSEAEAIYKLVTKVWTEIADGGKYPTPEHLRDEILHAIRERQAGRLKG